MKLVNGMIEMEQNAWPGSIGDSMAETARLSLLVDRLGEHYVTNLEPFITPTGYVRHPTAPEIDEKGDSWRESDSTSDQCLPWYLAQGLMRKEEMRARIEANKWRTGNGDLVSPLFYAVLTERKWLINLCLWGQIQLFKLSFRWSDEKNALETSSGSSADYLNFFHVALYYPSRIQKKISKEEVFAKVESYYSVEPNPFVVPLYKKVLDTFWGKV